MQLLGALTEATATTLGGNLTDSREGSQLSGGSTGDGDSACSRETDLHKTPRTGRDDKKRMAAAAGPNQQHQRSSYGPAQSKGQQVWSGGDTATGMDGSCRYGNAATSGGTAAMAPPTLYARGRPACSSLNLDGKGKQVSRRSPGRWFGSHFGVNIIMISTLGSTLGSTSIRWRLPVCKAPGLATWFKFPGSDRTPPRPVLQASGGPSLQPWSGSGAPSSGTCGGGPWCSHARPSCEAGGAAELSHAPQEESSKQSLPPLVRAGRGAGKLSVL